MATWSKGELKEILQRYQTETFSMLLELGHFRKMLSDKPIGLSTEKNHGGKQLKERIIVLVAANIKGAEKLALYAIGKYAKPRAFKYVKYLLLQYSANKKSMDDSCSIY